MRSVAREGGAATGGGEGDAAGAGVDAGAGAGAGVGVGAGAGVGVDAGAGGAVLQANNTKKLKNNIMQKTVFFISSSLFIKKKIIYLKDKYYIP